MKWPSGYVRNRFSIIAIAFLIGLMIPLVQYYFRRFDDNPFTGWYLIFLTTSRSNLLLVLFSSVLLALAVFRIHVSFSRPLFLFLAGFVTTVFFWSVPEINAAAARYVAQAKSLEVYGITYFMKEWGHGIQAWMDLPAVPFFDGLIFKIFGESRVYIQLFTAFLFGMTAVVTYLIGKTLWDEETGFHAGILLLGIPYLIIQTPLMLLDIHTMFFLTLSVYFFIRALEAGGIYWTTAAACAAFIAFFCKYSAWPMLSVLPVVAVVFYFLKREIHVSDSPFLASPNDRKKGKAGHTLSRRVVQTTLLAILIFLILVGVPLLLKLDVIISQIKLMMEFLRPSLGRWTETWASIYLFQINPVIIFAAAASIFLAAWNRDLKYLIIIWLPFLAFFFEIRRVRYILPVFPMFTLMAARGLLSIRNSDVRKIIVASVVITSLATSFFLYRPFLEQWSAANLEEAGQFLDTLDVDVVDIIAVPQHRYPVNPAIAVPLLDLSTHKRIFFHYIPGASTPDEDYHTSRFRDSWEYQNPPYYERIADQTSKKRAVALILAKVEEKIPPDVEDTIKSFSHTKSFTTYSPFLGNHTIVRIYW
jgi:4-amino-4-deoxy-L-arabinose transferase-like glycosyltransferase